MVYKRPRKTSNFNYHDLPTAEAVAEAAADLALLRVFMPFLASLEACEATVEAELEAASTILDPELFVGLEFRLGFSSGTTFFNWLLLAFLLSLGVGVLLAVVAVETVCRVGVCERPDGGRVEAEAGGVGVLWRIERLEISWSRLITVGVEETVVTTVAGFALLRALKMEE